MLANRISGKLSPEARPILFCQAGSLVVMVGRPLLVKACGGSENAGYYPSGHSLFNYYPGAVAMAIRVQALLVLV